MPASRYNKRYKGGQCCVCKANRNNYHGPIKIFPSTKENRLLWCVNLNLDPNEIASHPFFVCGRHFLPSFYHFDKTENLHKLVYYAFPTLIKECDWNRMFEYKIEDACASPVPDRKRNSTIFAETETIQPPINFHDYALVEGKFEIKNGVINKFNYSHHSFRDDSDDDEEGDLPLSSFTTDSRSDPSRQISQSDDLQRKNYAEIVIQEDLKLKKFIVYGKSLLDVLKTCRENGCNCAIDSRRLKIDLIGSEMKINLYCHKECLINGSPGERNVSTGNLPESLKYMLDGNAYSKLSKIADCMKLRIS